MNAQPVWQVGANADSSAARYARVRKRSTWIVGSCLLLAGAGANSASYDLAADWSDASNPNAVWTCRQGATVLGFVADWTLLPSPVAQPAWSPGLTIPAWFKSRSDNPEGMDFLAGDVVVHSTTSVATANVIWTSPSNGLFSIFGSVWMPRDIGRSNTWSLWLNSAPLTSGDIFSGDPFNRASPFNFAAGSGGAAILTDIAVMQGDVIELRIEATSVNGDFVGVDFEVRDNFVFGSGFE